MNKYTRKFKRSTQLVFALLLFSGVLATSNASAQNHYRITYTITTNNTTDPTTSNWDGKSVDVDVVYGGGFQKSFNFSQGSETTVDEVISLPTRILFDVTTRHYSIFGSSPPYTSNARICEEQVSHSIDPRTSCSARYEGGAEPSGCVYYRIDVKIESIATITTTVNANHNICPAEPVPLQTTGTFAGGYIWQYSTGNSLWTDISTTTTPSTTVTDADIGNQYMTNIFFRVVPSPNRCPAVGGAVLGPYVFSPGRVNVLGYTADPPACRDGKDPVVTVTAISRALLPNEKVQFELKGISEATSAESATLPGTIDGGNATDAPQGIVPGSYMLTTTSYLHATRIKPTQCGPADAVTIPVEIPNRDAVTVVASVSTPVSCTGQGDGGITLAASGGVQNFSYSRDGTTFQSGNTFGALAAGSYNFTVRDGNGCVGSVSQAITDPAPVSVTSAYVATNYDGLGAGVSCHPGSISGPKNDGSITIESSGGTGAYQYSLAGLSHTTPFQGSATVGGLYPDTYTVTVKDANGCTSADHPLVVLSPPPVINYSDVTHTDVTCNGIPDGTLQVAGASGGIGALQFSLNGSSFQNTGDFQTLPAGTFTVNIRDSKGCVITTSPLTINQPARITFPALNTSPQSCTDIVDGLITFAPATGGTGAHEYSLDGNRYQAETSPVIFQQLASGNYTVYARDSKGCVSTTSGFVGIRPDITGSIVASIPVRCYGDGNASLNLTPGGGTSPYTFSWSTNATTEDVAGLAAGTYTVDIRDSKGCAKHVEYKLTQPDPLAVTPQVTDYTGYGVSCFNASDGSINLAMQGGTSPYTYAWTTGSVQQHATGLAPGQYGVTVTDAHGCQTSLSNLSITQPTSTTLALGSTQNISCHAGADGTINVVASGGVNGYEYSLDGTTWQTINQFTGLRAQRYVVTMRDGNGCRSNTVDHTLTSPPALTLASTKRVDTTCGEGNGSAEVQASGGIGQYTYAWFEAVTHNRLGTAASITDLAAGDYQATAQDANGCTTSLTLIINASDGPQITQQLLKGLTCFDSNDGAIGVTVTNGLPPYAIAWDTRESSLQINNVTAGEHWVEVIDAMGCRGKKVFNVMAPEAITLQQTITSPLCAGQSNGSISVVASGGNPGGYSYLWSTGGNTSALTNIAAGAYEVTVADSKQCMLDQEIILPGAPVFEVDAGGDRTACVGQELVISAPDGNASYHWTSNNGFESNDKEVTITTPGTYQLAVTNVNGCEATDSFVLTLSNALLEADFLVASEAHAGDTVVLIDISWPVPEAVLWRIPNDAVIVTEDEVYAKVVFQAPGFYEIKMDATLGECVDGYVKNITVLEAAPDGGRTRPGVVERFDVFPNPNNGTFYVALIFTEPVAGRLSLVSPSGRTVFKQSLDNARDLSIQPSLPGLPSGIYFLILQAAGGNYYKRVMIE